MLARCEFFIPKMANSSFKILSKRFYPSLKNLTSHSYNTATTFKRFHVNNPDVKQIKREEQMLNLDIDVYDKKDMKLIFEPMNYNQTIPKVNIRSHLIEGFNYWMNLPDDMIKFVEELWILTYEAITLFDDTNDQSEYRRGLPPSYKIFGAPLTQISATVGMFLIMKKLIEMNNIKALEIYVDGYFTYSASTCKEIYFRENMICPKMEEYKNYVVGKVFGTLGTLIKIMQLYSSCKEDYSEILHLVCLHQVYQNDISNLCDEQCWDKKGFCEDISEGKYTLASIHAINSDTLEGEIVSNIYRQKTKNLPTLKYCLSLMEKLGSIDFAKKTMQEVENKLREEIERLGGNPPLIKYIDTLNSWGYDEIFPNNEN